MLGKITDTVEKYPILIMLPIVLVPVLPEYLAPIMALAAFSLACIDAGHRGEQLQIGKVGKVVLLYMAWTVLGVIYSSHPLNTLATSAMWAVMFLLYVAVTTVIHTKERLEQLMALVSLTVGVVGFIATVQYVLHMALGVTVPTAFWEPIDNAFYQYFPIKLDFHVPGAFRTSGTFNNPNIMAEYLVMAIPFTCYYAFSKDRTPMKLAARVALVFGIAGVAVSLCRGAYLALLVMCGVVAIFRSKRMPALLLAGCSAMSFVPESVFNRFLSIGSSDGSITNRLLMWQEALVKIAQRPIFGYGAGVSNTTDMLLAINLDAPHMHNVYLQLLIEGGFPSLICLGAMAFMVLRHSMDMHIRLRGRAFGVALIAFVAGAATCGLFDFLFMTPKLVGFFLIALGIADAGAKVILGHTVSILVPKESLASPRALIHIA